MPSVTLSQGGFHGERREEESTERVAPFSTFVSLVIRSMAASDHYELPRQVRHPFHPPHLLVMGSFGPIIDYVYYECSACGDFCQDLAYYCDQGCNFILHIHCAKLIPFIKSESHEHLLTFVRKSFSLKCNACEDGCHGPILRCLPCDFNLHVRCSGLASSHAIEHKCHTHPLTLTVSVVDDRDDEFYCDVCEQERDPQHPVYYCAECNFVAHIECVIPQALPSLEGVPTLARQLEQAELDASTNVDGEIAGKVASKVAVMEETQRKEAETGGDALASTTGGKAGDGDTADPNLAELDEEMDKLRVEVKAETAKLEAQRAKLGPLETKLSALRKKRSEDYDSI